MLRAVVDTAGVLSAQAQALAEPITTLQKALDKEHCLYLAAQRFGRGMRVLGLAKSGRKRLYLHGCPGAGADALREVTPVCLLDFFVHPDVQRQGWGRALLGAMLSAEQQTPEAVAYDRPSPKLIAFMARHFGLHTWRPQTNAFVVFEPAFWVAHGLAPARRESEAHHRARRSSTASIGDADAGGPVSPDWQAPAAGVRPPPRVHVPRVLAPPQQVASPGLWFAGAGVPDQPPRPQGRMHVAGR